MIFKLICIVVCGYLIGNINFAVIISHILKSDIRTKGSGNPGTMNMLRSYGFVPGLLCLILDMLKTAVPAFFAWYIIAGSFFDYANLLGAYAGGLAVMVGHVYPFALKFKGGKGVACILGLAMLLTPCECLAGIFAAVIIILTVHIGSLGSFAAILIPSVAQIVRIALYDGSRYAAADIVMIIILLFICFFEHRSNIVRLINHKENKVYFKKHL